MDSSAVHNNKRLIITLARCKKPGEKCRQCYQMSKVNDEGMMICFNLSSSHAWGTWLSPLYEQIK